MAGAALVIVEFAVNDADQPEEQVIASMEGIVRQIQQTDANTDILFVYTFTKNQLDLYKDGKLPPAVQWHERVAEHYGIPSVNIGAFAAKKILAGELTFEEFARDGVHPTDRGYAIYLEALKPYFAACKAAGGTVGQAAHASQDAAEPHCDGKGPMRPCRMGHARRGLEARPSQPDRRVPARA